MVQSLAEKEHMPTDKIDVASDFSAAESMARFQVALGQAVRVSKSKLNRLLAQDRVTPLVPQKRGPRFRSSASARASGSNG
jgi:hypothetical protein